MATSFAIALLPMLQRWNSVATPPASSIVEPVVVNDADEQEMPELLGPPVQTTLLFSMFVVAALRERPGADNSKPSDLNSVPAPSSTLICSVLTFVTIRFAPSFTFEVEPWL